MADVREFQDDDPGWLLVTDELEAIEARCRFRVIDGEASDRRNPLFARRARYRM